MLVRIKNNRLLLDNQVNNLQDVSDEKLRKIAAKYQIGIRTLVSKEVPYMSRGRATTRVEESYIEKTRLQIENEIRRVLTVVAFIPREFWTPEQEEAFTSNDLLNEKDITRENQIKVAAGIKIILPPFEKTGDKIKEAGLYAEVTEAQWDYLKDTFNSLYKRIKDDQGRTIEKKKTYTHRLMKECLVPQNDEDQKILDEQAKEEEKSKAKKSVDKK